MDRSFSLAIILLFVIFSVSEIFAGYSWHPVKISQILDINHFQTLDDNINRIIGIQTINIYEKNKKEACHYKSISREIKEILLNNEIIISKDPKIKDEKHIFPQHLKIGTEYVTEILLKKGLVKMNNDSISSFFKSRFEKAQNFAKNKRLGVWAPCLNDLNWQKIRGNYGGRIRGFKKENTVFMGNIAIGTVEKVISGNEFKLKNGPIIKLQNIEIPRNFDRASICFQKQSKNYLENLILGEKVRIEKEVNSIDIKNYKLIRRVFLNGKSREISINQQIIADGFGKYSEFSSSNPREFELSQIQKEVYKKPRGAWIICARDILNTDFSGSEEKISHDFDENCPIKGNISGTKKSPIKTYHTVLSGWYERINPEQCFETEEDANSAGFRKIK